MLIKEGGPFAIGCGLVSLSLMGLGQRFHSTLLGGLAGIAFLGALFCLYFFRDPTRQIPAGDSLILSPADGKILEIVEERKGDSPQWVVRIFLSIFEPHLQRAPIRGKVQSIQYTPGKFLDARNPRAAFENEQNRIEIARLGTGPSPMVVTQVAGLIARRIVCWVQEGQEVQAGERIGIIRFGSQVDLTLPSKVRLRVKAGDHVKAGSSIIAEG